MMEAVQLQNLDYIAVLIYIGLMAVIGLSFGWFIKDVGAYFKGSGTIPWIMATITNFMGLFSTFVFVAYAGIAYEYGMVSITVFWTTVPACIIAGILFGKRWRRTGHTTPIEYLEQRYGYSVRKLETGLGLVMRFLDNMVRLYAIGVFISVVTPLSLEWSIVISGVIVTAFNIIGGIWTVTIMSTVQMIILILVTFILLPLSLDAVGGLGGFAEKMPEHLKWFNGPKGQPLWLIVYGIMIIIKYNENWTFIQKFYCVKDEKAANKVGIVSGILFFVFTPIFLLPAVVSPQIIPDIADPEMSYVTVSCMLLPVGVMGIMFSSMFAATMSSLNSEYNIMAGVLTNDVYLRMFNPKADARQQMKVARLATLLVGVIMILGAIGIRNFGGAFEANKLFTGILAIPMGIPLIMGIVSKKPNKDSAVYTIIFGIVTGIVLNMLPFVSWEMATLVEIAICLLIYYYPAFLKTRTYSKDEVEFFEKIETPIREEDKPVISPTYVKTMSYLLIFSIALAGLLFGGMSIPSLDTAGGRYSMIAGVICLVLAAVLYIMFRRKLKK
ncbi:MAG: sodium transporter [Bacteroidales bacterium]|nr:sodium transporter [Bacteroidales bacterium]